MDNLSVENVKDFGENEKMTGKEFLQKCQLLQEVETSMYQKKESVNSKIKFRYSKDEMLKLRGHPLSMKAPTLQENLKFLLGISKSKDRDEPEWKKKIFNKKIGNRAMESNEKFETKKNENFRNSEKVNNRNDGTDEMRKSVDPKERIRKENDICLSPQRKSFTTGCYVANVKSESASNNANTNSKGNAENSRETREIRENQNARDNRENRDSRDNRGDNRETRDRNYREGSRRIGSGRIISRDPRVEIRGYPETSSPFSDYPYNRQYSGNKEIPTVVYERKFQGNNSFDREKDRVWDRQRTYNNYDKRKDHRDDEEEEEPEWMKEGPISLDDVIELKGFDEKDVKYFKNRYSKINTRVFHKSFNSKLGNERNKIDKRNSDSDNSSVASDTLSKVNGNSSEKVNEKSIPNETNENGVKDTKEEDGPRSENTSIQFNLEEILKLDPLPDISESGDPNESAGSRFTRWFKREENNPLVINGEQSSNKGFPFSTTTNIVYAQGPEEFIQPMTNGSTSALNLLDLLRGSQDNSVSTKLDMRVLEATGKLHSVEEIEAKLRGVESNVLGNPNVSSDKKKKEEETEAFKKLLSQAFQIEKTVNETHANDDSTQKLAKNENSDGKSDLTSVLCNGESHSNSSHPSGPPMQRFPPQFQSPADMLKLLHLQQNKQQQEMLSKVLMSSNSNTTFSIPPPSNIRPPSVPNSGPFSHIAPEIQVMINAVQPSREVMQRPDTLNILRALRTGEVTPYQLIEQFKKTTPYQVKFREAVLCVLKMMQMQYYNSTPVVGAPSGMSFNVPPPPPPIAQHPYSENILQQMMLNSQYRINGSHSGMPNIVYQRDFSSPNQNMYQNNVIKKHLVEQSPNIGQNIARMNSPTNVLQSPSISASVNITNVVNSAVSSQEEKNNTVMSVKSTANSQSLSFTPTSVLRKLSAEKENLDTFSKETKETKGEKNTIIPYTSNANNHSSSNSFVNQGVIDHFNGFGTCIPPPAISGQYFVGNMIRPANISTQVPIFGSPPPPVLSRLPVPSNSTVHPRAQPKTSSSTSQIQQLQMRSSNSQLAQMFMNSNFNSNTNRKSGDETMARWFSSDGTNQARTMSQNMGMSSPSMQNMVSLEEIERVQQSVHN